MIQQNFTNGNSGDGRIIMIEIDDDFILFYFYDQHRRHENYVIEENERRGERGEELLSEEESRSNEFYWIGKSDWHRPSTCFPEHMIEKMWFTKDMLAFINKNVPENG